MNANHLIATFVYGWRLEFSDEHGDHYVNRDGTIFYPKDWQFDQSCEMALRTISDAAMFKVIARWELSVIPKYRDGCDFLTHVSVWTGIDGDSWQDLDAEGESDEYSDTGVRDAVIKALINAIDVRRDRREPPRWWFQTCAGVVDIWKPASKENKQTAARSAS
jgi:hypothetical protein